MPKVGTLRVTAKTHGGGWKRTQWLQQRRWWGWKTIDREEVPGHVIVNLGAVGDTGGWVSRFTAYGRFGRDGIIHPRLAA